MTLTCIVAFFEKISHTGCSVNPSDTLVLATHGEDASNTEKRVKQRKGEKKVTECITLRL